MLWVLKRTVSMVLWVLKRTVSMRRSFEHPKHVKLIGKKIFTILHSNILFILSYIFTHKIMNLFTFSPNMKNGEGNLISLLLQLTEDLWTKAALLSMVKTFLFSLW